MKKFFYITIITLFSATASAQISDQGKRFIINTFPDYMPEYVLKNAEIVSVDGHYAKKHKKHVYSYTDLQAVVYQGPLRIGDSILVFNGKPFYSKGQNLFMASADEQKTAKVKTPKTAEERQQSQQVAGEIINGIIKTGARVLMNKSYSNTNGGVPF